MRHKLLIKHIFLIVIQVFILQSCGRYAEENGHKTPDDKAIRDSLAAFLTIFSEVNTTNFERNQVPDSVMIRFSILHNYQYRFDLFHAADDGLTADIDTQQVSRTAQHFFVYS